jgi:hypothetical protein
MNGSIFVFLSAACLIRFSIFLFLPWFKYMPDASVRTNPADPWSHNKILCSHLFLSSFFSLEMIFFYNGTEKKTGYS